MTDYVSERLDQQQLLQGLSGSALGASQLQPQSSMQELIQARMGGTAGIGTNQLLLARLQQDLGSSGLLGPSYLNLQESSPEPSNQQQLLLLHQLQMQQQLLLQQQQQQQAASFLNPYYAQLQLLQQQQQQQYQLQQHHRNPVEAQLQYQLLLQQLEREQGGGNAPQDPSLDSAKEE